jgi:hypothetical protein
LAGRDRERAQRAAQQPIARRHFTEARTPPPKKKRWDAPLGLGLVGVCLGWPAAVSVALLASAARLLGALALGDVGAWPSRCRCWLMSAWRPSSTSACGAAGCAGVLAKRLGWLACGRDRGHNGPGVDVASQRVGAVGQHSVTTHTGATPLQSGSIQACSAATSASCWVFQARGSSHAFPEVLFSEILRVTGTSPVTPIDDLQSKRHSPLRTPSELCLHAPACRPYRPNCSTAAGGNLSQPTETSHLDA